MKKILQIALCTLCSFTVLNLGAQVLINEYSASNLENFLDNHNRTEDWIELHNTSDQDMDISGYHLSDKTDKPVKWSIPEGTIIEGNGYLIFWCSGRDAVEGEHYHTNFKLSQTSGKDEIVFSDTNGQIIESTDMQLTLVEHSVCKSMDGAADWMICTEPTLNSSNNNAPKFIGYTATPSMDLEAGFHSGMQKVTLTNNEPNSVLRYTLDGTNPTGQSPMYTDTIEISETTVVKAQSFSFDQNILVGKMDFNTYLIDEDFTVAVFSVAADNVQDLANGEGNLIPIGSIEYFDKSKERAATSFGSLNRHGQDSWVLNHRSIDWVSRDEMGYSKAVEAPLFEGIDRDEYQKFMFRNSGDDNYPAFQQGDDTREPQHFGSTHIRDEYVQALAYEGGMKVDIRHVERVVVFLNGEYWGLYGMRDRPVDHDYTDYFYDQGKYDIQFLTTWGVTQGQYGERQAFEDWYDLRDFILENDMSDPDNYERVDDEMNTTSLIDYMVANLNVVAKDWLNYNTGWWRGLNPDGDHKKWGYILWDLDATFGYYINYTGVPNEEPDAEPCDINEISEFMDEFFGEGDLTDCNTIMNGSSPYTADDTIFQAVVAEQGFCCWGNWGNFCQNLYDDFEENGIPIESGWTNIRGNVGKHEKIFLKMIEESPEFQQLYYSRYADLMNTVYSCDNMIETLDRMVAVIEPEMPRQIDRWGGSMEEWQENVESLRQFVLERCELLDDGLASCESLDGPFNLTLMSQPVSVGEIKLNTLKHFDDLPWSGDYFGSMDQLVRAKSEDDDYEFSHWESRNGEIAIDDINDDKTSIQVMGADTLVAVFNKVSTSIVKLDELKELAVYPNPTDGAVNIHFTLVENAKVKISLMDFMGREIQQIQTPVSMSEGRHKYALNLDELNASSGVYTILFNVNGEFMAKKLNYFNE